MEILEESTMYKGWIHVIRRKIKHDNGGIQHYDIVNPDSHSVCALAFDTSGAVVLVEMYRFGQNKRLRELPAGAVESGEATIDAMGRELLEETGYQGELTEIGSHYIGSEHGVTRHVFIAKNCIEVAKPQPEQSEIDEDCIVVKVTLDEFRCIVRSGQMTETGAAFMALDHLHLL